MSRASQSQTAGLRPFSLHIAIHLSFPHSPSLEKKEKIHCFHVGEWSCRSPSGEVGGGSQRAAVGGECHSPAGGQRRAGTGLPCSLTGGDLRAGFASQGTSPPETAAPKWSRDVIIVAISCFHRGGDESGVNRSPRNAAWIYFTATGPVARGGRGQWNL